VRLRAASATLSDVERTAAEGAALYLYKLCDEASPSPNPNPRTREPEPEPKPEPEPEPEPEP